MAYAAKGWAKELSEEVILQEGCDFVLRTLRRLVTLPFQLNEMTLAFDEGSADLLTYIRAELSRVRQRGPGAVPTNSIPTWVNHWLEVAGGEGSNEETFHVEVVRVHGVTSPVEDDRAENPTGVELARGFTTCLGLMGIGFEHMRYSGPFHTRCLTENGSLMCVDDWGEEAAAWAAEAEERWGGEHGGENNEGGEEKEESDHADEGEELDDDGVHGNSGGRHPYTRVKIYGQRVHVRLALYRMVINLWGMNSFW